jgi:hypothetical protein
LNTESERPLLKVASFIAPLSHSTLPLAATGCHFLEVHTPIVLSLLSLSVGMAAPFWVGPHRDRARAGGDGLPAPRGQRRAQLRQRRLAVGESVIK